MAVPYVYPLKITSIKTSESEQLHRPKKPLSKFEQLDSDTLDLFISFLDAREVLTLRNITIAHQRYIDSNLAGIVKRMADGMGASSLSLDWHETLIAEEIELLKQPRIRSNSNGIPDRLVLLRSLVKIDSIQTVKQFLWHYDPKTLIPAYRVEEIYQPISFWYQKVLDTIKRLGYGGLEIRFNSFIKGTSKLRGYWTKTALTYPQKWIVHCSRPYGRH